MSTIAPNEVVAAACPRALTSGAARRFRKGRDAPRLWARGAQWRLGLAGAPLSQRLSPLAVDPLSCVRGSWELEVESVPEKINCKFGK